MRRKSRRRKCPGSHRRSPVQGRVNGTEEPFLAEKPLCVKSGRWTRGYGAYLLGNFRAAQTSVRIHSGFRAESIIGSRNTVVGGALFCVEGRTKIRYVLPSMVFTI